MIDPTHRPVFASRQMRDGVPLVLVGITKDTWQHLRAGKAVQVGDETGLPVRLVMLAGADQAKCQTVLSVLLDNGPYWNELHQQFGVK